MALLPISTDYTDKDFDSLRVRLYALVQSVFPEWTDQNAANFGNILLELFAFVGDVLCMLTDNYGRESRISTAVLRKSLLGLCKLINYAPAGAHAATADLVLSIPQATAGDVLFLAGTIISTEDVTEPIQFQLTANATIPAGSTSTTASAKNSKPALDSFTSSGLGNQEIVLGATPYLDDSAVVVAGNGAYDQVASFLDSTSADRHYMVVVDQADRATIRFGNGINGAVPAGVIAVEYETGGGEAGNVEPASLRKVIGTFTDSLGNAVTPSSTNPAKADGGTNRTTNAQIKLLAPLSIRAPTNCVAREDFEIHALEVSGVARALMATSNEDPSVAENTGILYIVPNGGGVAGSLLLAAAETRVTLTFPPTLTFKVIVMSAVYKVVNIAAVVYCGGSHATVRAQVEAALSEHFAPTNADGSQNDAIMFGAQMLNADGQPDPRVAWSDVFDLVRDCAAVRRIDPGVTGFLVNGYRQDVVLEPREFPQLGTITLIDGDTGVVF